MDQIGVLNPMAKLIELDCVGLPKRSIVGLIIVLGLTIWSYWANFTHFASKWANDPEYSHGFLVPVFAVVMLGLRRSKLNLGAFRSSWWGLPVLLAGLGMRQIGGYFFLEWFDHMSLIPVLAGISLLLGGWAALRWSWPAIAFLFFMIPLPYTIEVMLRSPLRRVGTLVSVYCMQTLGLPTVAEGYVILIDDFRIGVAEACSGLRMMMVFFAISTALALLIKRPAWQRWVVVASAIPLAVASNCCRVAVTGILYVTLNSEIAEFVFHDLAGWLMMPCALCLLWLELLFLSRLFIIEEIRPLSIGLPAKTDAIGSQTAAANLSADQRVAAIESPTANR